jgi:predicted metal-dependent peptidase
MGTRTKEEVFAELFPNDKTIVHTVEAERWDYLISSMVLNDPFIYDFLMLMSKHAAESVRTMGVKVVANMILLAYAPSFLKKLTNEEARWFICHEMLHVAFHHCTFRQSIDLRLAKMQNIAADMAINQLIPDTGIISKPRKEIIDPIMPEMYGFPKMLSMEQYFKLLMDKYDKNSQPDPGDGEPQDGGKGDGSSGEGDQEEQDADGSSSGKSEKGKDEKPSKGSGSGDEEEDKDEKSSEGSGDKEEKEEKDPLDVGDLVDNHEGWSDEDADLINSIITSTVEQFEQSGRKWGSVSGGIKNSILAAQHSQIKWWRYLRQYIGHLSSTVNTTTLKRPNRRYGYPFPGTRRQYIDKVLVCGDASASVSDKSWSHFAAEVGALAEKNPVDWVVFDTAIKLGPIPFTRRVRKIDRVGYGGTDFGAIFELAVKGRYKSMVILTDGAADPIEYPKGVKDVIWCIVGNGNPPVPWGKVVRIQENYSMCLCGEE